jgi:hypothetical protein
MDEIAQDHDVVMIHVIDIDDVHHLIVEDLQGNFLIEIKYSFIYIYYSFLLSEIAVVMEIVVKNVIVLDRLVIINQVRNDVVHLQRMIKVVPRFRIKMQIVKNIDYHTVKYDNVYHISTINRHTNIYLVFLLFTFVLVNFKSVCTHTILFFSNSYCEYFFLKKTIRQSTVFIE